MPFTIPSLPDNPTVRNLFAYYLGVAEDDKAVAAALALAHTVAGQPSQSLPSGIAVVWTGEVDAVPLGWALCGVGQRPANPSTLSSGYWIVKIDV